MTTPNFINSGQLVATIRKGQRTFLNAAMLCLLAYSGASNAETVRDNFETRLYSINDGTVDWSGDWVEVDGGGGGPTGGRVRITNGGELRLTSPRNPTRFTLVFPHQLREQ